MNNKILFSLLYSIIITIPCLIGVICNALLNGKSPLKEVKANGKWLLKFFIAMFVLSLVGTFFTHYSSPDDEYSLPWWAR